MSAWHAVPAKSAWISGWVFAAFLIALGRCTFVLASALLDVPGRKRGSGVAHLTAPSAAGLRSGRIRVILWTGALAALHLGVQFYLFETGAGYPAPDPFIDVPNLPAEGPWIYKIIAHLFLAGADAVLMTLSVKRLDPLSGWARGVRAFIMIFLVIAAVLPIAAGSLLLILLESGVMRN